MPGSSSGRGLSAIAGLDIGRFLESGDTIELRVDRIGALTN
jgi:2-keto-4-pentenoate hydratase/2-oxohepta-3-ene-1,7-dioic acid hydratase in catechol pathway